VKGIYSFCGKGKHFQTCWWLKLSKLGKEIQRFSYTPQEETDAVAHFWRAGKILDEPLGGILKAGAFKGPGNHSELLSKTARKFSHYTTSRLGEHYRVRVFKILEEINPNKKSLKKRIFLLENVMWLLEIICLWFPMLSKEFGLKMVEMIFWLAPKPKVGFTIFV